MTIRVLLADDHGMIRQGQRLFLAHDPEIEVVGEAADGDGAVALAAELRPDVVLMDLRLPGTDGVAATAAIRRDLPGTRVLAVTSATEEATVAAALRAGAVGYLLKDTEAPELRLAVKAAAAGQVQLSPAVARLLVRELPAPAGPEALTPRETAVLRLVARGYANKEIARDLRIGEKTVKSHVSALLAKIGVQTRTQAALWAAQAGLDEAAPGTGAVDE